MKNKKYYNSFDSIKGICIFLVCICGHFWQFTPAEYWTSGKYTWFVKFTNAVTHFGFQTYPVMEFLFMLSGFQMFASYNKLANGEETFSNYLRRKVERLFPLSVLTTVLMATGAIVYQHITGELWYGVTVTGTELVENLFNIQAWVNSIHSLNGPLWYISVYFFCLLLFYVMCRLGKITGLDFWIMLIPVIMGIYYSNRNLEILLLNNDMARGYLGFFFGVLLAGIVKYLSDKNKKTINIFPIGMIFIWSIIRFGYKDTIYNTSSKDQALISMVFLFAPLLILLVTNDKFEKMVGNRYLAYLGKISFSMYALNFPFYIWIMILDKAFHWNLPYAQDYMFWITSFLQILLAAASYHFYETFMYQKFRTERTSITISSVNTPLESKQQHKNKK